MKLEINITKAKFWILTIICIVAISAIIYAAESDKPNPGHDAGDITIGDEKIQKYIDDRVYYSFECVSAMRHDEGTPRFVSGEDGKGHAISDVVKSENNLRVGYDGGDNSIGLSCTGDWTMTGCSGASDEGDGDYDMTGPNACAEDNNVGHSVAFIRCCRLYQNLAIPSS